MYDLKISGGLVVDGTGTPGRIMDIGVVGDRIVAMGELPETAAQEIDATGRVLLTKIENEVQQLPMYLDVPNGLYYLMIRSKNQQLTKTIHIQR